MGKGEDVGLGGLIGRLDGLRDLVDGPAEARIAASIHGGRVASVEPVSELIVGEMTAGADGRRQTVG